MNNTLKTIRDLSDEGRALFADILIEGVADRRYYATRSGWDELIDADIINCWDDDAGNEFCEIGHQS
jgi:hypothetical protein